MKSLFYSFSDNSGQMPLIWSETTIISPMTIPIGVFSVTFIAMDPSHNQASCNFTINVIGKVLLVD